jgi:2-phospho-L-lactate guanylyltransferase
MSTLAILPVKSLKEAKQRLESGLEAGPRRLLAEAMLSDVLVALRRAQSVDRVLVVSSDHTAQQIAGAYGAALLSEDDHGHNDAAERGVKQALRQGVDRALLVPGDCPLLDPTEVDRLIAHPAPAPSVLIVPDRHGTGTNALLLTPPDAMASSFGPGSCERHAAAAAAAGIHHEVVPVPTLGLDVDTPEDLEELRTALASAHGGAAHTRGMLRRWSAAQA